MGSWATVSWFKIQPCHLTSCVTLAKWLSEWKSLSHVQLFSNPMDDSLPGSSVNGDSPGKNTGVGCDFLLQGIFPTQGLNSRLLHYRQILYHWATREAHMEKVIEATTYGRCEYWVNKYSGQCSE